MAGRKGRSGGQNRLTDAERLLKGVWNVTRHGPRPSTGVAAAPLQQLTAEPPPVELAQDAIALAEWSRVVPLLPALTELERGPLVALCQQWSRYVDAQQRLRADGLIVPTPKGPIVSPYLRVGDRALGHCLKLWPEFGLTPTTRPRIETPTVKPPTSKWAGLV